MLRLCLRAPGGAANVASGLTNIRGQTIIDICHSRSFWSLAEWLQTKIQEWHAAAGTEQPQWEHGDVSPEAVTVTEPMADGEWHIAELHQV